MIYINNRIKPLKKNTLYMEHPEEQKNIKNDIPVKD